jgi:hypothetical protein
MLPKRWIHTLALAAAIGVAVLFFVNVASWVVADSLCCADDAFFAVVAKNLAFGRGYLASYPDPVLPEGRAGRFDPGVTLGPTMILPAGAAIKLLGNEYWVPGAVTLGLIIGLLAYVIWEFARRVGSQLATAVFVLVLLWLLNVSTAGHHFAHWYAFLGEIPATLLVVLGFMRITRMGAAPRDLAIGGALFSLAVLTKTITAIMIPVAAMGLWWATNPRWASRFRPSRLVVTRLLIFGIGVLIPLLAFEIYQLIDLGPEAYLTIKRAELGFISGHGGSGIGTLLSDRAWREMAHTITNNWGTLTRYFKGTLFASLTLSGALAASVLATRCRNELGRFAFLLIAAFWLHFLWWLVLSNTGWIRHLLPALLLLCTAVATLVATPATRVGRGLLFVVVMAGFAARGLELPRNFSPTPWFNPSPRVEAMLMARDVLASKQQDYPLIADWWASAADMEYLLEGTSNFVHINHMWTTGNQCAVLYRDARMMNFSPEAAKRFDKAIANWGKTTLLDRPPYSIILCCR